MTDKQRKFQELLTQNIGNKKSKSLYSMLIESGYSEAGAKQQTNALIAAKNAGNDILEVMKERRKKAMECVTNKKLTASNAKDITDITDKLTKNIQLLSGGATDRNAIVIGDNEKLAIENLLKKNSIL